jgi:hypothetical protein
MTAPRLARVPPLGTVTQHGPVATRKDITEEVTLAGELGVADGVHTPSPPSTQQYTPAPEPLRTVARRQTAPVTGKRERPALRPAARIFLPPRRRRVWSQSSATAGQRVSTRVLIC